MKIAETVFVMSAANPMMIRWYFGNSLYPSPAKKQLLTRSAASVPVKSPFQSLEYCSMESGHCWLAIASHRANRLTFIRDNF